MPLDFGLRLWQHRHRKFCQHYLFQSHCGRPCTAKRARSEQREGPRGDHEVCDASAGRARGMIGRRERTSRADERAERSVQCDESMNPTADATRRPPLQAGASGISGTGIKLSSTGANLARGGRAVGTPQETLATRIIQLMVDARGNVHQLDAGLRLFGLPGTPGNPRLGRAVTGSYAALRDPL